MRRTSLVLLTNLFIALIITSCGGTGLITTIEIKITPTTRTMSPDDSNTFTGTETTTDLTGLTISTQATAFSWEVEEDDGGTLTKTSGDTTSYTYTAPS